MAELTLTTIDISNKYRTGEALYIDGLLAAKCFESREESIVPRQGAYCSLGGPNAYGHHTARAIGRWLRDRGLDFRTSTKKGLRAARDMTVYSKVGNAESCESLARLSLPCGARLEDNHGERNV